MTSINSQKVSVFQCYSSSPEPAHDTHAPNGACFTRETPFPQKSVQSSSTANGRVLGCKLDSIGLPYRVRRLGGTGERTGRGDRNSGFRADRDHHLLDLSKKRGVKACGESPMTLAREPTGGERALRESAKGGRKRHRAQ